MTSTLFSQAFARKWKALFTSAALSVVLSSTGCTSPPSHTEEGVVDGAILGGIFGTLIGIVTRHPAIGLAAGAAGGAAIGGVAGASADHAEAKQAEAVQQAVVAQQRTWPTLQDIAQMTANGTPDGVIINQIRTTGAIYQLDTNALNYLQAMHVSIAVITEMQATATRAQPGVVAVPPPGVVVQPGPVYVAPAPVVGVGWGYGGWHRPWGY
jgi:hypothetical protein